jgi:hypothetical protein
MNRLTASGVFRSSEQCSRASRRDRLHLRAFESVSLESSRNLEALVRCHQGGGHRGRWQPGLQRVPRAGASAGTRDDPFGSPGYRGGEHPALAIFVTTSAYSPRCTGHLSNPGQLGPPRLWTIALIFWCSRPSRRAGVTSGACCCMLDGGQIPAFVVWWECCQGGEITEPGGSAIGQKSRLNTGHRFVSVAYRPASLVARRAARDAATSGAGGDDGGSSDHVAKGFGGHANAPRA